MLLIGASFTLVARADTGWDDAARTVPRVSAQAPDYRSIRELKAALASAEETARSLADGVRLRVAALDDRGPTLNAVLDLLPGPAAEPPAGPLTGLPVLLKANIDTADGLPTHAGSLALLSHRAATDAPLVTALRNAGAVILGKTNLSEWANFRGNRSSSGWSSVGGQTRNPHVLDRSPCGSSSGSAVAVAAGMVPAAIGTETNGSIVCPAAVNGIVGYKPSIDRVDMRGVIPIASAQDVAGPFARSVYGAALVGAAMLTDGAPLAAGLDRATIDGLRNKRIGVWRQHAGAGSDERLERILDSALEALATGGASVIDPLGYALDSAINEASYQVMLKQFATELPAYLRGTVNQPQSLAAVMQFNRRNADQVMPWFGQELFAEALAADKTMDAQALAAALTAGRDRLREELEALFEEHSLDAVIALTDGLAWPIDVTGGDRFEIGSSSLAAISGWPTLTLPAGAVHGLPVGVSLVTPLNQDAALFRIAAALEARLPPPVRPQFVPTLIP
ncbi:MAG: amidase family protein [Pseudomonadota bacterium]